MMSLLCTFALTGLVAGLLGALAASALWWWMAPKPFLVRWSAHLREALDAGFAEHAVAMRLQAQADRMWCLRQEHQWRDDQEAMNARHEACFLAELRLLLKPWAPPATATGTLGNAPPDTLVSKPSLLSTPQTQVLSGSRKVSLNIV